MRDKLKSLLLNKVYQAYPNKISSGELQRWTVENTKYTPSNASRRMRELKSAGVVEVSYEKNHAYYTYKPKTEAQKAEERRQMEIFAMS